MWERLTRLLCVKSIVTLVMTFTFAVLAMGGRVTEQGFMTVFTVVIAFYFGTQSQKSSGDS